MAATTIFICSTSAGCASAGIQPACPFKGDRKFPCPCPAKSSRSWPPFCKRISKEEGTKLLRPGEIVFCVYDRESTNEPNRLVAASVGVAIPADQEQHGYLSEHHSFGETEEKAGEYAEDLAASMLATTLGIEFDPDTAWDERENLFKMSGKIVRTSNITQSAIGNKEGLWTTEFAACAFINDDN